MAFVLIDGAVGGFFDAGLLRRSLDLVNRARHYAEALIETVRESLIVLDDSLKVCSANQAFYRTFRTEPALTEGRDFLKLWGLENADPHLRERLAKTGGESRLRDYEVDLETEPLGRRTLLLNARSLT